MKNYHSGNDEVSIKEAGKPVLNAAAKTDTLTSSAAEDLIGQVAQPGIDLVLESIDNHIASAGMNRAKRKITLLQAAIWILYFIVISFLAYKLL